MSRIIVTKELADTLRSLRIQNRILSKDLAKHIGKSTAFVSKLEKGDTNSIDANTFYSIISFISNEDDDNAILERIYNSLTLKYSSEELERQLWLINFDTTKCKIPIPVSLVDDLNSMIRKFNVTKDVLLSRINSNESLPAEDIDNNSIPVNQWYTKSSNYESVQFIKIHLSESKYYSFLNGNEESIEYIFPYSIVFYLLKGENKDLDEELNATLQKKASSFLNSHKFYSVFEKYSLLKSKETETEQNEILSNFDIDNIKTVNDILSKIRFVSDRDIIDTNKKLAAFDKNLKWDIGFMLKLISLEFSALDNASFANKKVLINKISDLIDEYANMPEDISKLEEY